jgi:uncharacterized membrane protein HdeD (DUF308 family)
MRGVVVMTGVGPDAGVGDVLGGRWRGLALGAWRAVATIGVLAVVVGVLVLVWPGVSLIVVGALFGLYLVLSGVLQLVAAFGTHAHTAMRVLAFLSGALSILLGLLCFRSALTSLVLLAVWIGVGWLIRGIAQIVAAFSDPAMPARGWQGVLGALGVLAGIVLIDSPLSSIGLLTILGGCWLVVLGVTELLTAFRIRRHHARAAS